MKIEVQGSPSRRVTDLPAGTVFRAKDQPSTELHLMLHGGQFCELYGDYEVYDTTIWKNVDVVVLDATIKVYA